MCFVEQVISPSPQVLSLVNLANAFALSKSHNTTTVAIAELT